jgi:hypothetical protein
VVGESSCGSAGIGFIKAFGREFQLRKKCAANILCFSGIIHTGTEDRKGKIVQHRDQSAPHPVQPGYFPRGLAYEAGVDRAYVSRTERAVTYVGLDIIGKFAEVLKVDPAEFFMAPSRTHRKS